MADPWSTNNGGNGGIESPGRRHYALSASGTALSIKPRAVRCGTAGTITIEDDLGTSVVYTMTAGEVLTFRPHKVTAIGGGGAFTAWY